MPGALAAALRDLWTVEEDRVRTLALGGEGYTAAQYADVAVQLLTNAPHHAVTKEDAHMLLGRHVVGSSARKSEAAAAGAIVLQRMVEANALSTRPYSKWAQDIAPQAFERGGIVVTAPSAMNLYCMGRLRWLLDQTLKEREQQQEVRTGCVCGDLDVILRRNCCPGRLRR